MPHAYERKRGGRKRRAYARKRSARGTARRLNAILEHASPVLGSGLGKIGQAGHVAGDHRDPGIMTRAKPGPSGRGPGRQGTRGAGR